MCAVVVAYEQDEHRLIEEINRVCAVLLLLLLLLFSKKSVDSIMVQYLQAYLFPCRRMMMALSFCLTL